MIHILPNNDLKPHEESTTCECEPRIITDQPELIVVHNAYDGREGLELANDILNRD
jgi:hypothetical protein